MRLTPDPTIRSPNQPPPPHRGGRARIPTPREVFIAWSWGRRTVGVRGVLRQWACVFSTPSLGLRRIIEPQSHEDHLVTGF